MRKKKSRMLLEEKVLQSGHEEDKRFNYSRETNRKGIHDRQNYETVTFDKQITKNAMQPYFGLEFIIRLEFWNGRIHQYRLKSSVKGNLGVSRTRAKNFSLSGQ